MATIRDVARLAGVSIATVSRVLNGSARVTLDTDRRVRAAAASVDYWPNSAARSLTKSRMHALGVLLPDLTGEFFSEVIRGIDQAARREKFQILVSSSHADTDELLFSARSMRGRIDGLIAMAPDARSLEAIQDVTNSVRTVFLNPWRVGEGCHAISIANRDGAHAIVQHFVTLGHARIAILKGPTGNIDADERLRGFRDALHEAGLPNRPELELNGDFTEGSGYRLADALLAGPSAPTAVFAANDYMAIGLLSALRDKKVAVPERIAVGGFDDIMMARFVSPGLTTVRVNAHQLGERGVERWFRALRGEPNQNGTNGNGHEVLPTQLVIRSTCGSPEASSAEDLGRDRMNTRPAPRWHAGTA